MDIRRQFSACLESTPIDKGSVITITFAMKRDGSLLGKPRISYSHFNGDVEARRRFVEEVHYALDSCLPLKITPALGAAIAGQMFFVTFEGDAPQAAALDDWPAPLGDRQHGSKRRMFNFETNIVDRIANSLSDAEILAISALLFGLVGGLVAFLANRFWFRRWPTHSPYDDKLGEAAHTSMLGFSAFLLALLITNGLSSLSETEKAVRFEATTVYRLGQELDALGVPTGPRGEASARLLRAECRPG